MGSEMPVSYGFIETLKDARIQRGLAMHEVADLLYLSEAEYRDLEAYEDEWRTVTPIYVMRFLASVMSIKMGRFMNEPSSFPTHSITSIPIFVEQRRREFGFSKLELADRIGFYPEFIDTIENHPDGLWLWPVQVVYFLAQGLEVHHASILKCAFSHTY